MDTSFHHPIGSYEFDARCEMLCELGYDATYLTLWNETAWSDVPKLAGVKSKHGLEVAGVYATLDVAGAGDHAGNLRIARLMETLEGCKNVELAMRSSDAKIQKSDASLDETVIRWLDRFLKTAEKRRITNSLYPHVNFWLERIEDAVRLCRKVNHPNLRAVFCGFHWFAVDGEKLPERLKLARPFLNSVNICGSRKVKDSIPTLEPLDEGELDNFALIGLLRKLDYKGMVGLQGYSVGGDVYTKLKRSIATFRDMERRLDAHPEWADLRFEWK